MRDLFIRNINEHLATVSALFEINDSVIQVGQIAGRCLKEGHKIFFCGNGGSAADSQHLAAELTGELLGIVDRWLPFLYLRIRQR